MDVINKDQAQFIKMTTTPIPKLVVTLAIPTIISMLVTSIYNMADTYFVSKLGTSATGAVGIVFSLMAIIQAVGFALGMGSGNLISRSLGEQKKEQANIYGSSGFFAAIAFGLILTIIGLIFINPFMQLLGATPTILPFAMDYARYILFGAPIMCASFVLNNILRAEGKATLSMLGLGLGGILNILLDPIFIFIFELGISGAAIATLISQCVSFCILLFCFLLKKSQITLSLWKVSKTAFTYLKIIKVGFPSFLRQGLASIATVALNVNAAFYDDAAVAAMSVVGRIFLFILSFMLGFGQGYQPVIGYNFGAKKIGRVREAFYFSLRTGTVILTAMAIIGFIFAPQAIALFRKDDLEVITIGAFAFRAQCIAITLHPLIVLSNMTFQALGKSVQATFVASARQGIFFLPLILILPSILGLTGIQITQPCADILTALCCIPLILHFMKELNQMETQYNTPQEAIEFKNLKSGL